MSRSKPASLAISFNGDFLGIRVNTTGAVMADILRRSGLTSRQAFLDRVMPVVRETMDRRTLKLRDNLIQGVTVAGLGTGQGIVSEGAQARRSVQGLSQMEMTAGRYPGSNHPHQPHKEIPDILSRIVNHGLSVRSLPAGSSYNLSVRIYNSRLSAVMFYGKRTFYKEIVSDGDREGVIVRNKIPRVSTVARRLDETCLPFIQSGRLGDLMEAWAANSALSVVIAIRKELGQ